MTSEHNETYELAFHHSAYPHISYGLPYPDACSRHTTKTFNASKIYIIASRSLSTNRDGKALKRLQDALGDKVVGVRKGMTPHTLWSEILEIVAEINKLGGDAKGGVDLIVTLGAGSLTDASKIIALAVANNAATVSSLEFLANKGHWSTKRPELKAPKIPTICIPTSLSGGEYQDLGGGTKDETHRKFPFTHPISGPKLVILDQELTKTTPDSIWLSTGIRAVDHCVETICSLQTNDEGDRTAEEGLRKLVPGLLRCKQSKDDLDARLQCQLGVIKAMEAVKLEIPLGASHGIGHQLGPLGVGHGETSCILLPAVCKYNAKVNGDRQAKVREILWSENDVAKVLKIRGLNQDAGAEGLGDMLDAIISELNMPRSLKAVGVGKDKFEGLAKHSLEDRWCKTNPIPLEREDQVLDILQMVAE